MIVAKVDIQLKHKFNTKVLCQTHTVPTVLKLKRDWHWPWS